MAKRKLPKAAEPYRFQKGVSGNPEGGRRHNPEIKAIKRLTEEELVDIGSFIIKGSIKDLQDVVKDPTSSALKCMVAAVAAKAIQKGDHQALDALLNRLIGKVKDRVEVTSNNKTTIAAAVAEISDADLKARLAKINDDV